MKIILVVPPGGYSAVRWNEGSMPFLGIAYLSAVLEQNGFEVEILDAFIEKLSFKETLEIIVRKKPDLVGFTFATENRFNGFQIIKMVKNALPKVFTVAGGPHVSMTPDDTLNHLPELDYIVIGEGEETFLELVKFLESGKNLDDVKGIAFRKNGQVQINPPRPFIKDLDSLPFPAWHLLDLKKYNFFLDAPGLGKLPAANLMTSRGCPFNCNFCSSSKFWGRSIRMHSAERVFEEVNQLVKQFKIKALWFFDDTFTVNRKRVEKICELLISSKLNLKWVAEIRVDTVDYELLKLMKTAGCYMVGFGVESGSQRIIDEVIKKNIKVEDALKVGSWCKELGIISNPFLILSHPEETEEDALKTMDFIKKWPEGNPVSLAVLHIYPGTELEKLARAKKILPPDFSWSVVDKRVLTLPLVQGNVPIFIDKLSWGFLSQLMAEWAASQKYPIWHKIPKIIGQIRNPKEFIKYFTLGVKYLIQRTKKIFK